MVSRANLKRTSAGLVSNYNWPFLCTQTLTIINIVIQIKMKYNILLLAIYKNKI